MAQKIIFAEGTPTPPPTPAQVPANVVALPPQGKNENHANGGDQKKAVAKAKTKYKYPWWASSNPMEIFWGHVNEEVQIVQAENYHEAAKAATDREVLPLEFADSQGLRDELIERVDKDVLELLFSKIPHGAAAEKQTAMCEWVSAFPMNTSASAVGFDLVAPLFIPKDKVTEYARDWPLVQISVDGRHKGILGNEREAGPN